MVEHNDVNEVNTMDQITHHLNVMTNRVLNAEIALDIALGILFEDNESYQGKFEEKFEKRIAELNKAREEAMAKAQESTGQPADTIMSSATVTQEEPSKIITP